MAVAAGHIPERTCRVCRQKAPKQQLQRWVIRDSQPVVDAKHTTQGRGWYVCDKDSCRAQIGRVVLGQSQARKKRTHGAVVTSSR